MLPKGITAGPLQFPAPKRLPLGPLMDFGYEDEVLFPMNVNVAATMPLGPIELHAKVDWLVCREVCIPGKADLDLRVEIAGPPPMGLAKPTKEEILWTRQARPVPKADPRSLRATFQPIPAGFRLVVETGQRESEATFFPEDKDILDNPAPQKLTPTPTGLILDLKKDANLTANPAQLRGVLELSGGRAYEIAALPGTVAAQQPAQASQNPGSGPEEPPSGAKAPANQPAPSTGAGLSPVSQRAAAFWAALLRASGLAFIGGLLLNLMPCVFPVLFLKGLALVHSGHKDLHKLRAHGLVYAAGILVSFWALVAALLGLRAAGATLGWGFQFQSPVFLALMAGLLFFLGLSLAGQFEIGLTLTGAGGALAARQGYTGSFFTGVLAVVVATPCTAPFMGAAVGYALSAPAAVTFAVFTALALGLAAPYVALTLQPAWTRLLPKPGVWMEVLRQAISVPIFITVIWLAWVLAAAYGAGILAAVVALAVLAPKWFPEAEARTDHDGNAALNSASSGGWQPWSAEAVSRYLAQGRPVFVDFTASWCLSCQVNERVALNQPSVQRAFLDANVALLRADWTRHDEAITQALTALGRSGVPAYALYVPGAASPRLLPEVLTPGIVIDAVSELPKTAH
jgi:thiol:disulfide interchange protein DsbD